MAYPVELTIGTSNKVVVNFQSQEVSVSLTYRLERQDTDLLTIIQEKTEEVKAAHQLAWQGIREDNQAENTEKKKTQRRKPQPDTIPVASEKLKVELPSAKEPLTSGQQAALHALFRQADWSEGQISERLSNDFGKTQISELSTAEAAQMLLDLQRAERLRTQTHSQKRRAATIQQNGHI